MTEYRKQTGSAHSIELPSKIQVCHWRKHNALIGETVKFSIITEFIIDATEIAITIKNKSGSVNESITGQINANEFKGEYIIPENAEDSLIIEASINDYGIQFTSKPLLILRPVTFEFADKYKQQIEQWEKGKPLPFMVTTDTEDKRLGIIVDLDAKQVTVEKMHYAKEFNVEIMFGAEIANAIPLTDNEEFYDFANYVLATYNKLDTHIASINKA